MLRSISRLLDVQYSGQFKATKVTTVYTLFYLYISAPTIAIFASAHAPDICIHACIIWTYRNERWNHTYCAWGGHCFEFAGYH